MTELWQKQRFVSIDEQEIDFFALIPQEGINHYIFDEECRHNAVWDIIVSPVGRVFFSLCAELGQSKYVRLYEYLSDTNDVKLCFKLEDITFQQDLAIRASKVHTSMSFMNDGRLIMATHTTSQAPQHPYWMPISYYRHQFEGFQGSNIIIFDPQTGDIEHRGIPVPFESLYGGIYDSRHNAYYCTGMIRSHVYRIDIETNEVKDLGQISESSVYKLSVGPDGHIYTSTKMGRMMRINVDTQCVEDLKVQIPQGFEDSSYRSRLQLGHCVWHPNGKMYFCVARHPHLFSFDPKTMQIEDLGAGALEYEKIKAFNWPAGIAVDENGIIWHGVGINGRESFTGGVRLYSYDTVTKQRKSWGLVGTEKRALHIISEMQCYENKLYIADSNHQFDPAGILTIDLEEMTSNTSSAPPVFSRDVATYMCVKNGFELFPGDIAEYSKYATQYEKDMEYCIFVWDNIKENRDSFPSKRTNIFKLWQRVELKQSAVVYLEWLDNDTLHGICGTNESYEFVICDKQLKSISKIEKFSVKPPDLSQYMELELPYIPGRQYKAVPTTAYSMADGNVLIGTSDAMLAVYNPENKSVFSLGQAAPYGPIIAMSSDDKKEKVFGIASYPLDLGEVFSYDKQNGLCRLGRLSFGSDFPDYFADSSQPSAIAVSPDGKHVAFGVSDLLGVVYVCEIA